MWYRLTLGTGVSAVLHIDIMWVHVKLYLLYPVIHIQVLTYLLQNWCEQEPFIYILLVKMQKFYILVFVLHRIMSVENPNRWSIPWFRSIWARWINLSAALMIPLYVSDSHAFSTKECLFGSVASDGFWVERLWLSGVFWAILRLLFSLGLFLVYSALSILYYCSGFWATKARTVYDGVRNDHQIVFAFFLRIWLTQVVSPAPLVYP